jgi:DNA (cytosine-5)-methyltransferase 1
MRFGSVCSGIEAASVAWHPLGWEAAWLSEIEPFPCAVLKHHYPDVPNHGDMTLLPDRILSGEVEAPDLFCGGTPCQAFSVAGLRNSLDDARGNLSLTFVGIANAIDHVRSVRRDAPAVIFWENVPGVLNTKDNAFGCFLGALAGESEQIVPPGDKWTNSGCVFGPQRTVAWRVLDAQYFGVAQRRRRVFVVASARDDFNPAEVLFEFEGLRRDIAPSRQARKVTPTISSSGTGVSRVGFNCEDEWFIETPVVTSYTPSSIGSYKEGVGTLRANGGDIGGGSENLVATIQDHETVGALCADSHPGAYSGQDAYTGRLIPQPISVQAYENHPSDSRVKELGDVSSTVRARWGTGGGNLPMVSQPIVFEPGKMKRLGYGNSEPGLAHALRAEAGDNQLAVAYSFDSLSSNSMKSKNPHSGCREVDLAKTIDTFDPNPSKNQGGIAVMQPIPLNSMNCFRSPEADPSTGCGIGEEGEAMFTITKTNSHAVASPIAFPSTMSGTQHASAEDVAPSMGAVNPLAVAQAVGTDCFNGNITGDIACTMGTMGSSVNASGPTVMTPVCLGGQHPNAGIGIDQTPTLTSAMGMGGGHVPIVSMAVRRLTPVECERLQGFPDGYTNIPWRKAAESPDGPRYKALGNSWAVPVVRWIGQRIQERITT